MSMEQLIAALRNGQQADADGTTVIVSRQACEEAAAVLEASAGPVQEAVERERERWSKNIRETFEAMCAMRDAINEHIPMPSLESDLLQGPEASVFCAAVAEAVISAIRAGGDA